jgi:hypothetical protein
VSVKDKFTAEEWATLKLLPLQFVGFVILADGEIDDEEFSKLNEILRDAPFYRDPMHRELMLDLAQDRDLMNHFRESLVRDKIIRSAPVAKALLRRKLTNDQYAAFTHSLISTAIEIAQASGVGNAGQGKNISREEELALDTLIALYEIDLSARPATS